MSGHGAKKRQEEVSILRTHGKLDKSSDVQSKPPTERQEAEVRACGSHGQSIQAGHVASTAANRRPCPKQGGSESQHPRLSSDCYMCAIAHTCACIRCVGAHTHTVKLEKYTFPLTQLGERCLSERGPVH